VAAVMATGAHARPKVGDLGRLCQELREEVEVPRDAIDPYAGWIVIVEELLARARSEGAFEDAGIDLRWAAQFVVGAYVGVEELLRDDGFADRIDDHLRLTFRALGLHSSLLDPS
jgi:hypothetical protein